ncbi:hypothetical protein [Galbibacter sp. PAP.153]|uniref:hypothetical protein n=1 Tax=Galbibacter sp. PAP.153 TaxID=3104623 RepID=UPI00300BC05E
MKIKLLISLFIYFINLSLFSQDFNIDPYIEKLNKKVDSINSSFKTDEGEPFYSLPQTTGHYFELKTDNPDIFIKQLLKTTDFNTLIKTYKNLRTDFDLLIVKSSYEAFDYKSKKDVIKIDFNTYSIGNSQDKTISFTETDFKNKEFKNIIYKYTPKSNYAKKGYIRGFYLLKDFNSQSIPQKYNNYIAYTDKYVNPSFNLFYNSEFTDRPSFHKFEVTIIDSLMTYFEKVTNKPTYDQDNFEESMDAIYEWEEKRPLLNDSLKLYDKHYNKLLKEAIEYAKDSSVYNRDLIMLADTLINNKIALNLARNNQVAGSCSFDNSPNIQLMEMTILSAAIPNWDAFIHSSLSLLNDYTYRVANSSIASDERNTYINNLEKLNFDIVQLLLGSSYKIGNPKKGHYFSSSNKIGKAFANASKMNRQKFEDELFSILINTDIDTFNTLHFYNILKNYEYYLNKKDIQLDNRFLLVTKDFPYSIKSRIENPDKELTDLLIREKELVKNYNIKESLIANISSSSFSGECWTAKIQNKKDKDSLYYDLTMSLEDSITPFLNFESQKEHIIQIVSQQNYLWELKERGYIKDFYINFTNDMSFTDYNNNITSEFPKKILKNINLDGAVSIYTVMKNDRYLNWIITQDFKLILLSAYKDMELLNYNAEDLITKTEDQFLFGKNYYSYRVFDKNGKIIL